MMVRLFHQKKGFSHLSDRGITAPPPVVVSFLILKGADPMLLMEMAMAMSLMQLPKETMLILLRTCPNHSLLPPDSNL